MVVVLDAKIRQIRFPGAQRQQLQVVSIIQFLDRTLTQEGDAHFTPKYYKSSPRLEGAFTYRRTQQANL